MFAEVAILVECNPDSFGTNRAFAQAYSLFDTVLGIANVVGPGWSGAFHEGTNWQITVGSLAALCALGGVPVLFYTGRDTKSLDGRLVGSIARAEEA